MTEVSIKNEQQVELMRHSGQLLSHVFSMLDDYVKPGVSTMDINDRVEQFITQDLDARPASKGQYGYQYVLNSSINDVVCHGVPSKSQILKSTDIVNIDITLEKNGYITDSSKMYVMPEASIEARKLVDATTQAMWNAIRLVKPGAQLGDIGNAIQQFVEQKGYSVVREYCGHGIGVEMHEAPNVLHYGKAGTGMKLKEGMTFTIEPMINEGRSKIKTKKDGWTVVTKDKKLSAQTEHTILVTASGFEVLTLRPEEQAQLL